ncbi:MAG: ABC transporter permease, partial [Zymomonas sp.]|nr:ABC transporter permease [Zymomonas sp.]
MSAVARVCRNDLIGMARNRVAVVAIVLTLLLSLVAMLTSLAHRDANAAMRARFQAEADQRFDGQPARHPHRVVHYGHFVFRVPPPLAAFDPGVDAYTGNSIFLEGHRQNSANFGDVRQSSLLARFGALTPAFVLQILAPLVLIFVGFGVFVREREAGTLRQAMAQGLRAREMVAGKLLALLIAAALLGAPGALALIWLVAAEGAPAHPALVLAMGYAGYLAIWAAVVVFVSARAATSRGALLMLLSLWAGVAILIPRVVPDFVAAARPTPTRLETDIA